MIPDIDPGRTPAVDTWNDPTRAKCVGFLAGAPASEAAQRRCRLEHDERGYVMNASHLWNHVPTAYPALFGLLGDMAEVAGITFRERAALVVAGASALGDAYCALAWGCRLADAAADADLAAAVVAGDDGGLDDREAALARWARRVATDANATTPGDVAELRDVGFTDTQIFALTVFVAGRIAFSTVNDALGAEPDPEMLAAAPAAVRSAISFGRGPLQR